MPKDNEKQNSNQRGRRKARRLIACGIVMSILIGVTQGCYSLTRRIWTFDPIKVERHQVSSSASYVNPAKPEVVYLVLDIENNGRILRLEVTNLLVKYPRLAQKWGERGVFPDDFSPPHGETLSIRDFIGIPKASRFMYSYDFIIVPSKQDFTELDDLTGYVRSRGVPRAVFTTWQGHGVKIVEVNAIPDDFVFSPGAFEEVNLSEFRIKEYGPLGYAWRGVATPIALVADIVLVPVAFVRVQIDLATSFPH